MKVILNTDILGFKKNEMLEVYRFEPDGVHMFEGRNGSKHYIEREYYTVIPTKDIRVGQKWLSIEGTVVEIIDCDNKVVEFKFFVGGVDYCSGCSPEYFLENFKLVEE